MQLLSWGSGLAVLPSHPSPQRCLGHPAALGCCLQKGTEVLCSPYVGNGGGRLLYVLAFVITYNSLKRQLRTNVDFSFHLSEGR